MEKPTIFFSHSSNDSLAILPIKNKMISITANVIDIFMSSDGQSIPFGHNWLHKIEEGLNNAQIMFVFVTPSSINSAWIYFEAGFAYSKGIEVIPVGIGVNIAQLKPPLNLLQGFDITSADSLNNFVTVINKKFGLNFKEDFTETDYRQVFNFVTGESYSIKINEVFIYAQSEIYSKCSDGKGGTIKFDIDKYFYSIKENLDKIGIQYAYSENQFPSLNTINKSLLVDGISIGILGLEKYNEKHISDDYKLTIKLSTQNFLKSFNLLRDLILENDIHKEWFSMSFYLDDKYDCLKDKTAISSVISNNQNIFSYIRNIEGTYNYKDNFHFWIRNKNWSSNKTPVYPIGISFKIQEVSANDIIAFFEQLFECGLISKQSKTLKT